MESDERPAQDALTARLLVAMPGMGDPRFVKSVIYLCAHSPEGAMGLIVNKPAADLRFADLLDQLKVPRGDATRDIRVRFGGPVEHARGFVLHSADYRSPAGTMQVDEGTAMTATRDVIEALARGDGPARALFALGYAGWGPGQLESEIAQNGWLVTDATDEIVFGPDDGAKWRMALATLGIDPLTLSAAAGRA